MVTTTAPTRPAFVSPPENEHRSGLRLVTGTHQRRPWQIGLGIALVLVCAAVAGALFQSSAKRVTDRRGGQELGGWHRPHSGRPRHRDDPRLGEHHGHVGRRVGRPGRPAARHPRLRRPGHGPPDALDHAPAGRR